MECILLKMSKLIKLIEKRTSECKKQFHISFNKIKRNYKIILLVSYTLFYIYKYIKASSEKNLLKCNMVSKIHKILVFVIQSSFFHFIANQF